MAKTTWSKLKRGYHQAESFEAHFFFIPSDFAFVLAFDKFGCNGRSSCTFQLMNYPFLLKNQCKKYNSRNIKEEIK